MYYCPKCNFITNLKKIKNDNNDKNNDRRDIARYHCYNCNYMEKINPGTTIYKKESDKKSKIQDEEKFKNLKYSKILPRTREYICPNKNCESYKNLAKREAKFFRMVNSFYIKYICTSCGTIF